MVAVFILIILLLIILQQTNNINQRKYLDELKDTINRLSEETKALKNEISSQKTPRRDAPPAVEPAPEPKRYPVYTSEQPKAEAIREPLKDEPAPRMTDYEPAFIVRETWWDKWKKNNPDWEKFIGENLVNKIGIAVLVLGIAFFVKYAIDQNWIGEAGRVSIGLLCGVILTGLAHYLRNSYRSFSSVLAGGGVAVFYFSIAFAFQQYALISQNAAFLLMVVITIFAVLLSILYDRLELALIAAIGGFLTPFLVSTGQGNYVVLFTYLLILNSGLLLLAYFKRWFPLNVLSIGLTVSIFGGWLITTLLKVDTKVSFPLALAFATAFYFIFLAMNMVYQIRKKEDFKPFDFGLLLFLNASYFGAGMIILQQVKGGQFQGLFTLFAGFINLALAFYFFKRQGSYRNLLYLLIGLTLTYLSLSVPVQLEGYAITLFWSAEFVLLFWLWQRSRIKLFYFSSFLVLSFTVISLLMDWTAEMNASQDLTLIYSNLKGIVTNVVAALSFAMYARLLHQERNELPFLDTIRLRRGATLVAIVIAYMTAVYGVNLYFSGMTSYEVPNVYHRLVTEVFLIGFILWLQRENHKMTASLQVGAFTFYLAYHIFSYYLISGMRNNVLEGVQRSVHLFMHALSVGILLSILAYTVRILRNASYSYVPKPRITWIFCAMTVILFSQEVEHLFVVVAFSPGNTAALEATFAKAGTTIVWAICSFLFMWLGMRHKSKTLRIISLTLFGIALIKLFFADLRGISEGGKILAFTLLGVLLLTISFMYQKLKKIIIEDVQ